MYESNSNPQPFTEPQTSDINDTQFPLIQGRQGKYYVVNGAKYDEHFPQEWARNHLPLPSSSEYANIEPEYISGPSNCANCETYGSINGVFVCYCICCYEHIYNGTRGGPIYSTDSVSEQELWTMLPYMNGVALENIGDKDTTIPDAHPETDPPDWWIGCIEQVSDVDDRLEEDADAEDNQDDLDTECTEDQDQEATDTEGEQDDQEDTDKEGEQEEDQDDTDTEAEEDQEKADIEEYTCEDYELDESPEGQINEDRIKGDHDIAYIYYAIFALLFISFNMYMVRSRSVM
jgi:hypothetical protein